MISSKSSKNVVDGNSISSTTYQISPAKKWCFTMNNYSESSISAIFSCLDPLDRCIIGREVGETGTPHLQGFVNFLKKCRPISVICVPGVHFIKCKGSEKQNIIYCSKEGDFEICGNIKLPRIKKPVKIIQEDNLYPWEKRIIDIINQPIDDRIIYWITDKGTCNTGKTTFCKYLIIKHGAIVLGGKSADMKNGIVNYKGKNDDCDPELILVNLPKTFDINYLSYTGIEECKDMMFYSGKYEGDMVCGNCPHFFIFSNELPNWEEMDPLRWKVLDININKFITREECSAKCLF